MKAQNKNKYMESFENFQQKIKEIQEESSKKNCKSHREKRKNQPQEKISCCFYFK